MKTAITHYTHANWKLEGAIRFGTDPDKWKFICPSCGYIAMVKDWKDLDAAGGVAFSCIGRYTGSDKKMGDKTGGPCNYTTGGLFNISPITIEIKGEMVSVFDFAPAEEKEHV